MQQNGDLESTKAKQQLKKEAKTWQNVHASFQASYKTVARNLKKQQKVG